MSEALIPKQNRPAPQSLSRTPAFEATGVLPRTSEAVAQHVRVQQLPLRDAEYAAELQAEAEHRAYPGPPCMKMLNITLCFDGTNNHEPSDKKGMPPTTSNVARLYHASIGPENGEGQNSASKEGFFRYYIQGVGTEFKEIGEYEPSGAGLKYATGGENRINWGLTRLLDAVGRTCGDPPLSHEAAYELVRKMGTSMTEDVLGAGLFSDSHERRVRAFQVPLATLTRRVDWVHRAKTIPKIIAIRLWVYGFSRGAAQARAFASWLEQLTRTEVDGETCYLFAGIPIRIGFLGLFDTVAAAGMAYLMPFAEGHMGWADDSLRLPDSERFLERCVHLVAAHEQRGCFPVDSIRRKANPDDPDCPSTYRAGTFEYLYPGMHSDVGGGYPPGDQGKALWGGEHLLSQIPLQHMYAEAFKMGAPLQVPPEALSSNQRERWPWIQMDFETFEAFNVSDTLANRFNTWLADCKHGPLENVMASQAELITGWRINRYANSMLRTTVGYQHYRGKDMTAQEIDAFEALHARHLADTVALQKGKPLAPLSESEQVQHDEHLAIKQAYEQRTGARQPMALNASKAFEPDLTHRQMENAMKEFLRDYLGDWKPMDNDAGWSTGTLVNALFGGLVYMTNEQDEADEYRRLREGGNKAFYRLYDPDNGEALDDKAAGLTLLFDEHVHDSRAWFMNAALNERELFSDYFRYRGVFFDDESNKRLSLLATTGQVLGVALAVASVGLTVKRKDPRYLTGLVLPSLAIPAMRGKLGPTQIIATDSLTGIALPMVEVPPPLRDFTRQPGAVARQAAALPLPPPLNEQTATTPELQQVLDAVHAAAALKEAARKNAEPKQELDMLSQFLADIHPLWLELAKKNSGAGS
ncbi:T6SS phospholipase effector Tle1-like catalytic domain-containing protein [Pseudomonas sp. DWP3-1-2]|uniref:T6SS phospholipase effector Tle1-like catalytic domain-containing protein n=1 Tax=Pseudomonas sp. DWP3-1-2 TaxID=2804645 RepID=UPI003CECC4D4